MCIRFPSCGFSMSEQTKTFSGAISLVVVFSVLAYIVAYLVTDAFNFFGITLFVVLPALAGIIAGSATSAVLTGLLAFLGGSAFCLASLLILRMDGVVGILLASPLMAMSGIGGVFVGRFVIKSRGRYGSVVTLLLSLLIVGCSTLLEGTGSAGIQIVKSIQDLPGEPEDIWEAMVEIDGITAKKPFLLQLGWPVLQYCTMEGSGIGAIRTCYFDQGYIKERISVWVPPRYVVVSIIEENLPGPDWFQYIDASYQLSATGIDQTRIRRASKISSVLRPRVYWKRIEALVMKAEHQYFFDGIVERLGGTPTTGSATIQATSKEFQETTQDN